ncbi:MAG: prevent-host-death family protein [Verrucomicrobia bacterium]|nr:prevent-host-death family protein [Verrucomicrobiota bacterium]
MSTVEMVVEKAKRLSEREAREVLAVLDRLERDRDEEREDIEASRQALAEPGENIPWETIKQEAGLK